MQETRSETARNRRIGGSLEERFQASTPATRYQYVDVHFVDADVDTAVEHLLLPAFPNHVNYEVVQSTAPVSIYHDSSSARRQWTQGVILLRSNVANVAVRLKLTLPSDVKLTKEVNSVGAAGSTVTPGGLIVPGNVGITGTLEVDGVASFDAAVDIDAALDVQGVLTTQAGIDNTGGAIAFPAVQVPSSGANTLDDYEEGLAASGASWTPTLLFGGAATGMTYGANTRGGWYTKVGRIVTVVGRFTLTAKGSSTGTATITGLPFAAHNDTPIPSAVGGAVGAAMAALTSDVTIRVTNGSQIIDLFDWGATGVVALDETNFTNTTVFTFSLTYLAAA